MKNRFLPYIAVSVILLALAYMVDRNYKDTELLRLHADEITLYAGEQYTTAKAWIEGHRNQLQAFTQDSSAARMFNSPGDRQELTRKDFTILLHRRDTLLFWSNNNVLPGSLDLLRLDRLNAGSPVWLPQGVFMCYRDALQDAGLSILVPLRYNRTAVNDRDLFPANKDLPANLYLTTEPTAYPVRLDDRDLLWLGASGSLQPAWVQALKLGAYGLLLLLILVGVDRLAIGLARRVHPLAGFALPLLSVLLLWSANWTTGWTARVFGNLPLFDRNFTQDTPLGHTVGDWLSYTVLLLWVMVFFHRSWSNFRIEQRPYGVRLAGSVLAHLAIMLNVLFSVDVFRRLVLDTGIDFNFNNIAGLDRESFAALAGIILLMAALFLLGHRLSLLIRAAKLSTAHRVGSMFAALALLFPLVVLYPADLQIGVLYILGFALAYTLIYDLFTGGETTAFVWVVIWLLIFSLFSAFVLNRYNQLKDSALRAEYARALATDRDDRFAEPALARLLETVQSDPQLQYLLKPWPFKPETRMLRQYINLLTIDGNYLFEHYRLQVYAFDRERQPLLREQAADWQAIHNDAWEKGNVIGDNPEFRFHTRDDGTVRYMLHFRLDRMGDPSQPADLFYFFDQQFSQRNSAYARTLFQHPFKGLEQLQRFDFAVWRSGRLIVEQGRCIDAVALSAIQKNQVREIRSDDPPRIDAVARSADGNTLSVVGRAATAWYRQVYLFAILFALASLLLFAVAVANPWLRLLPDYFQFSFTTKGSLSRRIHYSNIALIVLAFLVIGLMTFNHFSKSARESVQASFDKRSESVLAHLRTRFANLPPTSDTLVQTLQATLSPLATSLAVDVNLYAPSGELIFATEEDLRQTGLIPSRMNAATLDALRSSNAPSLEVAERFAGQSLSSRYMPLRNSRNQLLAYLSIPSLPQRREIGQELSDFMGMLASLYVFLLLVAGAATLFLARSIIRPVRLISDRIKELRFEDKNEPLPYAGDRSDELGELISEYNRMVDKLEDSKTQLIRLEREGAWREMARQIAHDIKNPLTTMKLSMQQLERVSNDPAQAAAYLKKAITRLIEQIDSLAQIASEFSMFANLDIRQRQDLVLNDVVENVIDLFAEQKEVELRLNLPEERFHISGDKSHLIRVFNNLVINAIQAIPQDRRGKINVLLYRKNDHAVVQIRDNGSGIPPEIQVRVFEPSFTTKTSGSGLGLAICRRIVEALDGTIRFETRAGEGTDFFVEFPIASVE